VTESERDEAANTLLNCIAAVFKQAKSRDPAAHPWIGAMLATEHLRQLGTSVFIQLTRWGSGPPAAASHGSAPAAPQARLDTPRTQNTAKAPAKQPAKRAAPARSGPADGYAFTCPACGEDKRWMMDWAPIPGKSVCVDCYKAGRTP